MSKPMNAAQRTAWDQVWIQLKVGNPTFFENGLTGLDSALTEIKRLQEKADENVKLREALRRIAGGHVPSDFSFDGPKGEFQERLATWCQRTAKEAL
jgi:hypothetical protein